MSRRLTEVLKLGIKNDPRRRAVLVVGCGLHSAATGSADSWGKLLSQVAQDTDSTNLKQHLTMTGQWEHFLCTLSRSGQESPSKVERALQLVVSKQMKQFQAETLQNERARSFYSQVLGGGFSDILSLNFDICLEGAALKTTKHLPSKEQLKSFHDGHLDESLFRHYHATLEPKQETWTRVWHPHGDLQKASTLKLGVRSYGSYIKSVSHACQSYKIREKKAPNRTTFFQSIRSKIEELSWIDLFMSAPLVFAGTSLSSCEWPLWWALHQRARNFARYPKDKTPATLVLGAKGDQLLQTNLAGSPANVELLLFDSHDEMWEALLTAEAATPT
eukprot:m.162776 g.162776  ORF g.162776 m.162776 type:complete len:332 (-) comp24896_c0_seq2:1903-2898(-)